jgi:hypothetical protein
MSTPPVTYDTKSTWGRRKVVSVTLTLTCCWLLPGISIFSSARLFVSLPKICGLFAALNAGNLIHGGKTNKQKCGLASFDSGGSRQSPLPRNAAFVEYTYFLLNMCHKIHSWVMKQDKADTGSDAAPDFESMFDICRAETKSQKGGFFNVGNMRPKRIPSAKNQSDGCNCGVYTCLPSIFVAVERTNPGLWTKIETLADLDKEIVKPFWDLHENKEDRMINFRYRICRLMEFFLDKRLVKKQRSMISVGGHPLPGNWVYQKKLRHANLRLPPCAGGPIPTAYARERAHSIAVVKMVDGNDAMEESDQVKKERNDMQEYLILSFVDRTGIAKKSLELYNKAFKSWAKQKYKASSKNHQRRKSNFKASWSIYQDRLQDYIQKNEFAPNHGVCDEFSCSVCVHPLPDCCRFYGDQLSCIDCYRRRHVIFVSHAIRDGDSSQLLAKKGTASNDVKTPSESNEKARSGEGKKNEDKNDKVAKKDGPAQGGSSV